MAKDGNPNSVSDAGVGALCVRTAVYGAYLNVRINAGGLSDKEFSRRILSEAAEILEKAAQIAVICAGTGNKVYELSCEDVDVMHDFYEKHYSKRQQGEE